MGVLPAEEGLMALTDDEVKSAIDAAVRLGLPVVIEWADGSRRPPAPGMNKSDARRVIIEGAQDQIDGPSFELVHRAASLLPRP